MEPLNNKKKIELLDEMQELNRLLDGTAEVVLMVFGNGFWRMELREEGFILATRHPYTEVDEFEIEKYEPRCCSPTLWAAVNSEVDRANSYLRAVRR